jgi:hypothetical protein
MVVAAVLLVVAGPASGAGYQALTRAPACELYKGADWFRRPVPVYGASDRPMLGDVLPIFTAIATLSNAAAWTYRLEILRNTPLRTVATVQTVSALLTTMVQAGTGALLGSLAMVLGPVIGAFAVLWMFLLPAAITRAVFWFVAGRHG